VTTRTKDEIIPADVRQAIVRHLGAALAERWGRDHVAEGDEVREGQETGEGAVAGAPTLTTAV
jgi:hypothetical protein